MNAKHPSFSHTLLALSLAATLVGCNSAAEPDVAVATAPAPEVRTVVVERERAPAPAPAPVIAPVCDNCGTITSVEQMKSQGKGSGVGAVLGAIAGGVAGHQFGKGRGKDVATAAGAVGGGFAGNEIEQRVKGEIYFHVTVAMENGGTRVVDVASMEGLGTGSKVKVVGNDLQYAGA